jgi:hypothetical protein
MTLSTIEIDNAELDVIESAGVKKGDKSYQAVVLDIGGSGTEKVLELSDLVPTAGTASQTTHEVTDSVTTALAANANRIKVIIQNLSDVDVWLQLGSDPAVNDGLLLAPRGEFSFGREYTGDVRCIRAAGAGTKNLFVLEL